MQGVDFKKNILFVIPWLPYPLKSGGHQALFNGIRSIQDDYEVHLVYVANTDNSYLESEKEFVKQLPHVHLHPFFNNAGNKLLYTCLLPFRKVIGYFRGKGVDKSFSMCTRWISSVSPLHEAWLDHVSKICKKIHFDIIQVEMPWLISQVLTLPKDCKKVFVHHELGFVCRELEQKQYGNNEYINACRAFADNAEISLLNLYDAIITLSPVDRMKLLSHGVNVPVYASFATVNQHNFNNAVVGDGKQLSFVGPDSHFPNLVGITWFLDNCWNELKKLSEDYKLKIIGKWDEKRIVEYSEKYPGVQFLGFVDNLDDALKESIMIVPITIGSGIRMKILEACSIGIPFVSTNVGAEGIPVVNGEHCFLADTPEEFISSLINIQKPDMQKKFVQNSQKLIEKYYSSEALRKNRIEIYSDILSR